MDPLGIVTGLLIGVVGSAAAVYFARLAEDRKDLAERRHRIYLMLLDVHQRHFWIASHEIRGEEIPREVKESFQQARWKVADELRGADDLKQLPDVMDALFSMRFASEGERGDRISEVIDMLAKDVNPRFVAAAKRIETQTGELILRDAGEEWSRRRRKIEPF